MWCVPKIDQLFKERMEDVLELYERPYNPKEPMVCFDEKSKQLLADRRESIPAKPCQPRRADYQYERKGTRNLFIAVEPKAGQRKVKVTKRRTKADFAKFIKQLTEKTYQRAEKIHIVLDNLNTHFQNSLQETFDEQIVKRLLKRICFHYTPYHASWLNMAEIEIGILNRQCLNRRIPTEKQLCQEVNKWQTDRNKQGAKINWRFTRIKARKVFKYHSLDSGKKLNE